MAQVTLFRSKVALRARLISTGLVALLLILLASITFSFLLSWAPRTESFLTRLSILTIIIVWCVQSFAFWNQWKSRIYEVDDESIAVYKKNGMWGRQKTVYRYESIISVRMVQGYFGKKYNYGDIYLTIPKLDKEVVLHDVSNPDTPLRQVQQVVAARGKGTQALIS